MQAILSAFVILVFTVCAHSHDLKGLGDKSIKVSKAVANQRIIELSEEQPDPDARYVISRILLWQTGQTLKACFFSGTAQEKKYFIDLTRDLLAKTMVNLSVDFGEPGTPRFCSGTGRRADLRISFSHGCCAAYVGKNAHYPDQEVLEGPTIKIEGIFSFAPEKRQQIVTHEIFHVLGLEHEHQSPAAVCENEFIKEAVLNDLKWTEEDFKTNLARLDENSRSYRWSTYDNASIMKYFFDEKQLKNGKASPCYSAENYEPSKQDIEGLADAYPKVKKIVSRARAGNILNNLQGSLTSEATKLVEELQKFETE